MHSDKRKEVRSLYPSHKGKLQVLFSDKYLSVSSVKDVSPTGIRLEVKTPIEIGESIRIRYVDEKIDIQLNGTIAWNSTSASGSDGMADSSVFLIGVKLASPSLLQVLW